MQLKHLESDIFQFLYKQCDQIELDGNFIYHFELKLIAQKYEKNIQEIRLKWSYPDKLDMIPDCFHNIQVLHLSLMRMTEFPFDFTRF